MGTLSQIGGYTYGRPVHVGASCRYAALVEHLPIIEEYPVGIAGNAYNAEIRLLPHRKVTRTGPAKPGHDVVGQLWIDRSLITFGNFRLTENSRTAVRSPCSYSTSKTDSSREAKELRSRDNPRWLAGLL